MSLTSLKSRIGRLATTMVRRCGKLNSGIKAPPAGTVAALSAETTQWLERNRLERMDATLDLFDEKRREFHLDRYRFAAARVERQRVLDCACGTGYGVRLLCEFNRVAQIIGVDIEPASIAYARHNHGASSAVYLCASADCLPFADASFDMVTSFETIEHVPDDRTLIEEFHRVLRPGGQLIVSTPNQWPLADAPFHVREYNRSSFMTVLETWFHCFELYNQNSGSATPHNHGQGRGVMVTTPDNEHLAECYIAVCTKKS